MKTKLLALLSALLIAMLLVTSCGGAGTGEGTGSGEGSGEGTGSGEGSGEGEGGEGEGESASGYAYQYLAYTMDVTTAGVSPINVIMQYQNVTNVRLTGKTGENLDGITENVITIGDTGLAVSTKAITKLQRELRLDGSYDWDTTSYIIYSDGTNVAIYWDNDYVAIDAVERFIELVQAGEEFERGFFEVKSIDSLAAKEAEEAILREEALAEVAEVLGAEAAQAIREHLALVTEEFCLWLADLYEPRTCVCEVYDENGTRICQLPKDENGDYICHGGGFYYSNSGRDTEGYLIDIESTVQAINFLSSSGMLQKYGGSTAKALPAQMKADVAAFAKSLQSAEDGYFYHPQWGTGISVSRRGRDLGWATQIITTFGFKPLYNAPNGTKGELGAPGQKTALAAPLAESTVTAVSKVQLAATAWPDHLKTVEAFEAYLNSFNFETSSYSAGNTLSSQAGQINNRDKEGIASGEFKDENNDGIAEDGLVATFERVMNAKQYPENGLWQDSVHYNSVNGLMKIGSVYNSLKVKLNYADKAFESAATMVLWDPDEPDIKGKSATGSVDVYNPWVALSQTLTNVNRYAAPADVQNMRATLREQAADMIRVTTEKTKKFAKEDGSYGYTWTSSPSNSQGAPVAVPGTIEGDVNGGCIALRGVWGNMIGALGISGIAPTLYYDSDFDKFIHRINELQPVIKHTAMVTDTDPYDFEDEDLDSTVFEGVNFDSTVGTAVIAKDPTNATNKTVKITKAAATGAGATMSAIPKGPASNKTMLLLEWDMYVESGKNNSTAFQIRPGDAYMFTIGFKDGTVTFGDSSSTSSGINNKFGKTVPMKTWFNVRIEVYPDGDGTKPLTKVFINDELIATSDNYFGKPKDGGQGTINSNYSVGRFYALYGSEFVAYFDNILVLRKDTAYTPGGGITPPAGGDSEDDEGGTTAPTAPAGTFDFESSAVGDTTVTNTTLKPNPEEGNSVAVVVDPADEKNKMLCFTTVPSTKAGNQASFNATYEADGANCYVMEFDVEVDWTYAKSGFIMQTYFRNTKGKNISSANFYFKAPTDDAAASIEIKARGAGGKESGNIGTVDLSKRATIRMEYYTAEGIVKYYANGSFIGEMAGVWDAEFQATQLKETTVYTTYSTNARILFDNVKSLAIVKAYAAGAPAAGGEASGS